MDVQLFDFPGFLEGIKLIYEEGFSMPSIATEGELTEGYVTEISIGLEQGKTNTEYELLGTYQDYNVYLISQKIVVKDIFFAMIHYFTNKKGVTDERLEV